MNDWKIVFPSTDLVNRFPDALDRLLLAIGKHMTDGEPKDWADGCWVSDLSSIGDFGLDREELDEIENALGVELTEDDLIYDVANKLAGKA